jgi:predicted permease
MSWISRSAAKLRYVLTRADANREFDEELQAHLQMLAERYERQGMEPREAWNAARRQFGNGTALQETRTRMQTFAWLETLKRDVRFSLRSLRRNPVFAGAAIVTLALGIAANSTIFSMVSRFVLYAAPVGRPATLMALHTTHDGDTCCNNFTWPLFVDVREQARTFSGVAAYYELVPASVGGLGEPERVWGQAATANFFNVAQLTMTLGRGFSADEERAPVVVIGERLWRRRFGADRTVLGRAILLSGQPFTVVGVAPPGFRGVDLILDAEFWIPLRQLDRLLPNSGTYESRDNHWLAVIGRLKDGVTQAQAAAELGLIARRVAQAHPDTNKGGGFRFERAGSLPPRDAETVKLFLAALSAVVLLVLGIACANVANLLLAQAAGRQREMAMRLALGATRGQLLRQLLTESVLLALGGGVLGVLLALAATRGLTAFHIPAPVPLNTSVSVDWRVLLFTLALSLGTGLLFGIAPALAATRPAISNALKGEEVLGRSGRLWSLRNFLVVSQIAMSLILLCATGLFLRSMQSAASMDTGLRSQGVLTMSIDPRLHGYTAARTTQILTELRERVAALPGVASVACTDVLPLSGGHRSDGFQAEGRPGPLRAIPSVEMFMASPGYFKTLGIPLIAGRDFGDESATGPKVAIVDEAFAHLLFPNENPVGQRVSSGGVTFEIIGLTKHIKSRTLGEEVRPVLFRSLAQSIGSEPSMMGYSIVVRSSGDPATVAGAVRREIHTVDPTLAVYNAETMDEHLRSALFLPRLAGTLFGVVGIVGLLLAAIGLYGVMSYSISRRTREIGIRMALGAQSGGVQRLVVRQGMSLTLIAVALGLGAAWAAARLLASFLYGVPPHDPVTFTVVPLFLAAVALLACWLPARRAAGVDPLTALRHE